VQDSLAGECLHESLDLTVLQGAAQKRVRGWEASGQVGVIRNEIPTIQGSDRPTSMSPTPRRGISRLKA